MTRLVWCWCAVLVLVFACTKSDKAGPAAPELSNTTPPTSTQAVPAPSPDEDDTADADGDDDGDQAAADAPCPGPGMMRRCNGVCVNIGDDNNHCGGCNNRCPSGKTCDGHMFCRDAAGNL